MTFYDDKIAQISQFVTQELASQAHDFELNEAFPQQAWQRLTEEFRIFDLLIQEDNQRGLTTFLEIVRLLSTESPSLSAIVSVQGIYGILPLNQFGTPSQKASYLSDLVSGTKMASFAFSEEGRDLSQELPQTLAQETETGWELSGRKYMVSNAQIADLVFVLARTKSLDGQEGTGVFILSPEQAGVTIEASLEKTGMKAMPLAPIVFDRVSLEKTSLLGGELLGQEQCQAVLLKKRLAISSQSIGIAQGVFQKGLADSKIKRGFGKRPIDVTVNQFKFADMEVQLAACEAYYYDYLRSDLLDERRVFVLKLMSAQLAKEVADEVIRITGAYSFVAGDDIERYVRDAQLVSLYGGSSDNLRRRISKDWL